MKPKLFVSDIGIGLHYLFLYSATKKWYQMVNGEWLPMPDTFSLPENSVELETP